MLPLARAILAPISAGIRWDSPSRLPFLGTLGKIAPWTLICILTDLFVFFVGGTEGPCTGIEDLFGKSCKGMELEI